MATLMEGDVARAASSTARASVMERGAGGRRARAASPASPHRSGTSRAVRRGRPRAPGPHAAGEVGHGATWASLGSDPLRTGAEGGDGQRAMGAGTRDTPAAYRVQRCHDGSGVVLFAGWHQVRLHRARRQGGRPVSAHVLAARGRHRAPPPAGPATRSWCRWSGRAHSGGPHHCAAPCGRQRARSRARPGRTTAGPEATLQARARRVRPGRAARPRVRAAKGRRTGQAQRRVHPPRRQPQRGRLPDQALLFRHVRDLPRIWRGMRWGAAEPRAMRPHRPLRRPPPRPRPR